MSEIAPEPIEQQGQPEIDQEPLTESLGNAFLKNIPDVDRKVLEPYVKQWDAGVTKRFQAIHQQYAPYKSLGDIEVIQRAMQVVEALDNDPEFVYNQLAEFLQKGVPETPQPVQQQPAIPDDSPYSGLPEAFVSEFSQMRDLLVAMAQSMASEKQTMQQEMEDQQLQSYLESLHNKHGEFDEEFVLSKMSRGMDGEDAVKSYNAFVQGIVNRASGKPTPPPILNGQGGVPSGNVDPKRLDSKGSKELMAQFLANVSKE